jgi:hypothetical protein
MNKKETKQIIKELRVNRGVLNRLELAAERYKSQHIPHNLDGNVLYELELLQETLTRILYFFYLGDVNRDYYEGKIGWEEKEEFYNSKRGKMSFESQDPFFSFGYVLDEFINDLERLK